MDMGRQSTAGARVDRRIARIEPRHFLSGAAIDELTNDRFFRHLVLNLRTGVVAISLDGRIAAMNDMAYRVLALTPRPTDIGRPFAEVLYEYPEIVRVLQQAFETDDLPNRA